MTQEEYFSVNARLKLNISRLAENETLPDQSSFADEIPPSIQISKQCAMLDQQFDQFQDSGVPNKITSVMQTQNQKIDLILGLMLSQLDHPESRYFTQSFGGSGFIFRHNGVFQENDQCRVKIFLTDPVTAVFCYGKVEFTQAIDNTANEEKYESKIRINLIQEDDQDLLIRSALLEQQALLRQRANKRKD